MTLLSSATLCTLVRKFSPSEAAADGTRRTLVPKIHGRCEKPLLRYDRQLQGGIGMVLIGWPKTIHWSDFGTPVSSVPSSYAGSHTDCHIEIDIAYSWGGVVPVSPGGDYQLKDIKVVVSIAPLGTWVLQGVSTGSNQAQILTHEQGHYNIGGIAARDVETALKNLRNADQSALVSDASTTADGIISSGQTEEDTYDGDAAHGGTDHGNDATQQAKWNGLIAHAKSLDDLP